MGKNQHNRPTCKNKTTALAIWLFFTYSAAAGAFFVSTDGWYDTIAKPSWTPPNYIFGPVWTFLYAIMAVSAWLIWADGGFEKRKFELGLYVAQWSLNLLWTPAFFGMKNLLLAFVIIVALAILVWTTLFSFFRAKPLAGFLLTPYALWTSFAAALNFRILCLNS